jgi:hypothetical protein
MSRTHPQDATEERVPLESADARLVERLRDAFAPEPAYEARRAAFEARLLERIESAQRPAAQWSWPSAPALAGLCLALAAAWLGLRGGLVDDAPAPTPQPVQIAAASRADQLLWEESLFFPATAEAGGEPAELPGEYQAIALAFFGETL